MLRIQDRVRPAPVVMLVVLCLLWACVAKPPPILPLAVADRNLVVIVIDCLRVDHLGCYGYHRPTSPCIDRLASEGIVFERARANSSFTQESVGAILTGLYPSRSGIGGWGSVPGEELITLGELFTAGGYRTGFFSNSVAIRDPGYAQGFEVAEILNRDWNTSGGGPKLSQRAIEFAREHRDERFVMYLHYLDPHGPYRPPDSIYRRFSETRPDRPIRLYGEVRKRCSELVAEGFGPGEARFEDLKLRYDAEIAHVDSAVEELLAGLKEADVLDKTLLVITADHGEEFLEHGFVEHAWTLYDEVLRVPLIFWTAGLRSARLNTPVALADLLPTLLTLAGVPHHSDAFDGQAIFRSDGRGFVLADRSRIQVAETLIVDRNVLRSMIDGRWKYIAGWHWLPPEQRSAALQPDPMATGVDIWGKPIREELYDLAEDPSERHDVAAARPEVVARFRDAMASYLSSHADSGLSPSSAVELSDEAVEALRALGYF